MVTNERIAPVKNTKLKAIALGVGSVVPGRSEAGTIKRDKNTPEITGPIAPPIILMVAFVAETIPVDSFGVKLSIMFGTSVIKIPPNAKPRRTIAVCKGVS